MLPRNLFKLPFYVNPQVESSTRLRNQEVQHADHSIRSCKMSSLQQEADTSIKFDFIPSGKRFDIIILSLFQEKDNASKAHHSDFWCVGYSAIVSVPNRAVDAVFNQNFHSINIPPVGFPILQSRNRYKLQVSSHAIKIELRFSSLLSLNTNSKAMQNIIPSLEN